ncbi:primosomal protein N' [Thermodesulfobacteriota bacterium]
MRDASRIYLKVAVPLPVRGTFSYIPPEGLHPKTLIGRRAIVPFGSRRITGYIIAESAKESGEDLKKIEEVLDAEPLFPEKMAPFFEWVSDYYMCPVGLVIQSLMPSRMGAAPYKTARLTETGLKILEGNSFKPKDKEILVWVKSNPDKRLKWPFSSIMHLERKGWLTTQEKVRGKREGHLIRKFVRCREDKSLEMVLGENADLIRAKNEKEFLKEIFNSSPIQLSALNKKFSNGSYLVKKWHERGVLEISEEPVFRDPTGRLLSPWPIPDVLFDQQKNALGNIKEGLESRCFSPYLLHGVTGSGKTEVYLRAAEHAIEMGRRVILMVPEISLAIYMESAFRHRLKGRIGIYHSGLSSGERHDQWVRMVRGDVDLVIGARSALFSPLKDLGLIIVDEEHDLAYKQENIPRYHARDAAVVRAKMEQAVVVLGSGTPSIQSYNNSISGKYRLLNMPERVENRPMPEIKIVDMKLLEDKGGKNRMLTPPLVNAIKKNLEAGSQTILFLNRRGFNRLFICRSCGKSIHCPNCDVTLTHHFKESQLSCHYCGYSSDVLVICPLCKKGRLKPYGFGTEKLEHELADLFPGARSMRMDADSLRKKGRAFSVLKKFSNQEIDILVGTQIITKGYDFPNVTLVGIVAADLSLEFPDFRGGERTFQILSQVAGRAGRGESPGRVFIQTFNPEHYAVRTAIAHDYESFFQNEIILRNQLGYPPFSHLACLRIKGNLREETRKAAGELGRVINERLLSWPNRGKEIQVLGPVEAPISKLKGKYRWQILLKGKDPALIRELVWQVKGSSRKIPGLKIGSGSVNLSFDVDPYNMI